jgi:retron-type reverse transcriptase
MQTKLSLWAEQDKSKRFYDLFDLLHQGDWIRTAYTHVKQNVGSRTAGCDGVTMRDFEKDLEGNLQALSSTLYISMCVTHSLCQTIEVRPWDFYQVWVMSGR